MAEAAPRAAAAAAGVLGSLQQCVMDDRNRGIDDIEMEEEVGSSVDWEDCPVAMLGEFQIGEEEEESAVGAVPVAAEQPQPAAIEEPPQIELPKAGSKVCCCNCSATSQSLRGTQKQAKKMQASRDPTRSKQYAHWAPVNQYLPFQPQLFEGKTGPTNVDKHCCTRQDEEALAKKKEGCLFFFEKFFHSDVQDRIVKESNDYVAGLANKPRPTTTRKRHKWPPTWVSKWNPLDQNTLMQWIAFIIWMGFHRTAGEREIFSQHWLY